MTVLTIQQTTGHRLVQVLEPVHADNRWLAHRLLDEVGVGRTTILFPGHLSDTRPERSAIARAEVEFGDQHRLVQRLELGEVITLLWLERVQVETQHVAILRAGPHGLWCADGKPAPKQ
ncbi:hypothetical protein D3C85_682010 [compost metagenome]